jgi:thiol-disulfide isomerase/thioredoxin
VTGDRIRPPSLRTRLAGATRVSLIHFTAPWCPPCRLQSAEARRFAEAADDPIGFIEVDVSADITDARDLSIVAVPTLLFMAGGRELRRLSGFCTRDEIAALYNRLRE